jgi:hypothetical protein
MARPIALMALAELELSAAPCHEPCQDSRQVRYDVCGLRVDSRRWVMTHTTLVSAILGGLYLPVLASANGWRSVRVERRHLLRLNPFRRVSCTNSCTNRAGGLPDFRVSRRVRHRVLCSVSGEPSLHGLGCCPDRSRTRVSVLVVRFTAPLRRNGAGLRIVAAWTRRWPGQ